MSKPKIQIFMWKPADSDYVIALEFDMELKNNAGGVPDNPLKYYFNAIALNHLKIPVMIEGVHLTQEGIEIYVSPAGD